MLGAVKRRFRGFRSLEYFTNMLYFVAGKLKLPATKSPFGSDEEQKKSQSSGLALEITGGNLLSRNL